VTGGWRRLHDEELCNLYASSNVSVIKSRRMRWAGHVALLGKMRNAYNIYIEKPEGIRPCERPRSRWKDNIIMNLRETVIMSN